MEKAAANPDQRFSPVQLAAEFGEPLGNCSYHVRALLSDGLLAKAGNAPRRGAVESEEGRHVLSTNSTTSKRGLATGLDESPDPRRPHSPEVLGAGHRSLTYTSRLTCTMDRCVLYFCSAVPLVRIIWLIALSLSLIAGAVVGLLDPTLGALPHRFGYYMAAAALLAGIAFGIRGAALPIAATAAFGVAKLLNRHHSGDEQTQDFVKLFLVLVPAAFGAIALFGALLRAGTLALTRGGGHRWNHPR